MPLIGWAIVALVVGYALSALTMKRPKMRQATLDDFDVPQVDEGTPHAVVFGDGWLSGWQVLWYGNYRSAKYKYKDTKGFRYSLSLLSGLCRGPINELVEIRAGKEVAWQGHKCDATEERINKPDLFGGPEKDGGLNGSFLLFMGKADQVLPSDGTGRYLTNPKASIGGLVSEMRGVTTVWYDGAVSDQNPYIKEWEFRVRRTFAGWLNDSPWYPEKSTIYLGLANLTVESNVPASIVVTEKPEGTSIFFARNPQEGDVLTINGMEIRFVDRDAYGNEIEPEKNGVLTARNFNRYVNARRDSLRATSTYDGHRTVTLQLNAPAARIQAMNAAHVVYECYTDKLWGRGLDPAEEIDENSFIYAANKLCDEGFGITLIWYRKEDIEVFIQKVCDLVGAVTYTDRETGRIVFRLIRDDYNIADVPLFTPETGLLSIDDDDSQASSASYNEIIGTSVDPVTNLQFQVRAQNLAAYQSQNSASSMDQEYKGIPTKELLARVVTRDLRAMASGLKKYTVTLDRRGYRVAPGSVIRISHPGRGISNLILRVGDIDDGNMLEGAIKIKAAIDVFGLPATGYTTVVDAGWVPPARYAVPPLDERLVEANYRDLYLRLGAANAEALLPTDSYIGTLALQPNATTLTYDIATRVAPADYSDTNQEAFFTGRGELAEDLSPMDTQMKVVRMTDMGGPNVGEVVLVGDELVLLTSLEEGTGLCGIVRGIADTVPAEHFVGDTIWTIDDDLGLTPVAYPAGTEVNAKLLTRTSSDALPIDQAEELSVVVQSRQGRPYPPAAVTVNGQSVFEERGLVEEPSIAWVERDRKAQAGAAVGWFTETGSPEPGVFYRVRVYAADGETLLRQEDDSNPSFVYTKAMQTEDGNPGHVIFDIASIREGLSSFQPVRFEVRLGDGWGNNWGERWGG